MKYILEIFLAGGVGELLEYLAGNVFRDDPCFKVVAIFSSSGTAIFDAFAKSKVRHNFVIPAKAGIQSLQ